MIDQLLYAMMDATQIPVEIAPISDPYSMPYGLPPIRVAASPEESRMAAEVILWTGWSNRTLAQVIGTSHPTIRAIREGRAIVGRRNHQYPQRLKSVHDLVSRAFVLTHRDPRRTNALLSDGSRGDSPKQYLIRGEIGLASRAILDLIQPGNRPELIGSWRPLSPRNRTVAPSDEE